MPASMMTSGGKTSCEDLVKAIEEAGQADKAQRNARDVDMGFSAHIQIVDSRPARNDEGKRAITAGMRKSGRRPTQVMMRPETGGANASATPMTPLFTASKVAALPFGAMVSNASLMSGKHSPVQTA